MEIIRLDPEGEAVETAVGQRADLACQVVRLHVKAARFTVRNEGEL